MQDLLLGSLPCAFVFNINWRYPVAFKLFFFFGGGGVWLCGAFLSFTFYFVHNAFIYGVPPV